MMPSSAPASATSERPAHIVLDDIRLTHGERVVQERLSFRIRRGDIFIVMGGSGCGKSTLMRCLTGLLPPAAGRLWVDGVSFWESAAARRAGLMRRNGVMYQSGALWSAMTLGENVALPLEHYSGLGRRQILEIVDYKLALVGLAGFGHYYPAQISGGMRKRAGVARAMALDPDTLFFDEPSAGLDPLSARHLDELIVRLRAALGTTMVVVSHDLDSIFAIGDDAVMLDAERRTMLTTGAPRWLREHSPLPAVRAFLTRGAL